MCKYTEMHDHASKYVFSNRKCNAFRCIQMREYRSTLYAGLARAVSSTNTNFR